MKFIVIKTTFEKKEEAESLAKCLINEKLVSCVQISEIDSFYTWKGEFTNEHEYILTMKTRKCLYKEVERKIKEKHSYEVPQIIAMPIYKGLKEYLNWIEENTRRK